MVNISEARKKMKTKKTVGGKKVFRGEREKPRKLLCAVCSGQLSGVQHGQKKSKLGKNSKTQKRPSVLFGGILCATCREIVLIEAIKIKSGLKKPVKTSFAIKPFVEIAIKRIEE